jgi:hypothetical protein
MYGNSREKLKPFGIFKSFRILGPFGKHFTESTIGNIMTMNDDEEYEIKVSPLSQAVTRDGKTVEVQIYEGDRGKWILEVVDQYDNSTVWDDQFESDQEALAIALETIDEEGIDSLIDSSSAQKPH